MNPAALREADAARYIGMRPNTLRGWRRLGTGPAYLKVGRAVLYLTADLDRWLALQPRTPEGPLALASNVPSNHSSVQPVDSKELVGAR